MPCICPKRSVLFGLSDEITGRSTGSIRDVRGFGSAGVSHGGEEINVDLSSRETAIL